MRQMKRKLYADCSGQKILIENFIFSVCNKFLIILLLFVIFAL